MKKLYMIFSLLVTTTAAHAELQSAETRRQPIPLLNKAHWSYAALNAIYAQPTLTKSDSFLQDNDPNFTFTRYEAAVSVVQFQNYFGVVNRANALLSSQTASSLSPELVDAFSALEIEFAPEIARLSLRT